MDKMLLTRDNVCRIKERSDSILDAVDEGITISDEEINFYLLVSALANDWIRIRFPE